MIVKNISIYQILLFPQTVVKSSNRLIKPVRLVFLLDLA